MSTPRTQANNARVLTIDKFEHMRRMKEETASEGDVTKAVGMKRVFDEVAKKAQPRAAAAAAAAAASKRQAVGGRRADQEEQDPSQLSHYSTGAASGSFTSTAVPLQTRQTRARKSEDAIREEFYKTVRKKGYARLHTSHGDINIELHADLCPRACAAAVASFLAAVLAEIYLCGVCFCQEMLRRNGQVRELRAARQVGLLQQRGLPPLDRQVHDPGARLFWGCSVAPIGAPCLNSGAHGDPIRAATPRARAAVVSATFHLSCSQRSQTALGGAGQGELTRRGASRAGVSVWEKTGDMPGYYLRVISTPAGILT
eukprot:COSAG01_NODE_5256_length_4381_cov_2.177487_7_plen_314_part_00